MTRFSGYWTSIEDCTNQTQENFLAMATRIFEKEKRDFNGFDPAYANTRIQISGLHPEPAVGIQKDMFTLTR